MSKFTTLMGKCGKVISKNGPAWLTGIGIAGMIGSTVSAVVATTKAVKKVDAVKKTEQLDVLPAKEVVKITWKYYVPTVALTVASTACLIGANTVSTKRAAALATAYKLSETALSEYKEKVVETIGEKKEQVIREKIAQDKLDKKPDNQQIVITGKGDYLCFDPTTNQEFYSDREAIREAINNLNEQLLSQDYVSLNDFYSELNIPPCNIGEYIGWNISRDGQVKVTFSGGIANDGRPCLVLDYTVSPRYDYYKLM